MKQTIIVFFFMLFTTVTFSQNEGTDIIFPANGDATISNCTIKKIQDENMIIYQKDNKEFSVKATAIKRNGEYIDFTKKSNSQLSQTTPVLNNQNEQGEYNGFNYKHYEDLQAKGKTQKQWGAGLTLGGLGLFFIGAIMAVNSGYDETTGTFENESKAATAGLLEIGGIITTLVGIPVWISGGVKYKKATEGMANCKKPNVSFNIGTTQNGVGLVMKF